MSCMNLGKSLKPAKRVWKIFTTTLSSKLCRLKSSKSIKKSKTRVKTTSTPSSSIAFRSHLNHKRNKISKKHMLRQHRLLKRPDPVYIDDLFKEHVVTRKEFIKEKGSTSYGEAKLDEPNGIGGIGKREKMEEDEGGTSGADDMWESLQLASPLMHGINEKADEFIARIRAEMHLQKTMACRL